MDNDNTTTSAPQFAFVGLVVSDMTASVGFYRRLGLEFPEGAEAQPHVEADLPGGLLLVLDSEETVRSFHPGWRAPRGGGRTGLAFRCAGPEQVDAVYEELVGAGCHGELKGAGAAADTGAETPGGRRVSTLELFFYFYLVFTITELTVLPAGDLSFARAGRRPGRRAVGDRGPGRTPSPRRGPVADSGPWPASSQDCAHCRGAGSPCWRSPSTWCN
ncbi:catechol 2,3-dioxygenase-like lactoylglutathione lyase family enzyme [Streptacidiphilus sp. MAP12-33]